MEASLYDPEDGYYSRRAAIGEGGDFLTSPSISPLFARAVARTFAVDAEANLAGEIVFLEAAAGSGRFLEDFHRALADAAPGVLRRTRLLAVERTEAGRRSLSKLGIAARIFSEPPEPLAPQPGWIFSNELYDALPVHRVQMRDAGLFELGIDVRPHPRSPSPLGEGVAVRPGARCEGDSPDAAPSFGWTSWPAPPALSDYLDRFGIGLVPGQAAEINLAAAPLYGRLARLLSAGRLVTFDYGHRAPVLYHPHARPAGTLAVHSRGMRGGDPLEAPGTVDLTAHVNWNDLIATGEDAGFATEGLWRQSRFLLEAGLFEDAGERKLEALRLFDPEGLGDALSVLFQSKGVRRLRFFSQLTSTA